MKQQNYSSHARYVTGYHFITSIIILAITILSVINLFNVAGQLFWQYTGLIPLLISIVLCLMFYFMRAFALKAQDRAIRAEENFRYFILTGKRLDQLLRMSQIIALRFAPDEEMVQLADRAVKEKLSSKEIKKAIVNWRADNHRA
ncbi:MAG: DUF6526 family protein [Panacibacter sp.]